MEWSLAITASNGTNVPEGNACLIWNRLPSYLAVGYFYEV